MHRFSGNIKMGTYLALFLALMILLPNESLAQSSKVRDWNDTQDPLQYALGLHYGKLAGHGLSFRLPLTWFLYVQVGGGIWHTSSDEQHNLGVELNYILRQDDRMRLYVGVGAGYFYHNELVDESGNNEVWSEDSDMNVGAGIGLEYLMGTRWALQGELDFVHTGDNGDIKVAPQVGIHYYW